MSMAKIVANLDVAKESTRDVLDSLEKLKGEDYTDCVRQMLHCLQAQDIVGIMAKMLKDAGAPTELLDALGNAMSQLLSSMVTGFVDIKIGDSRCEELIDDAEMVQRTAQSLLKTAIRQGENGVSIGE